MVFLPVVICALRFVSPTNLVRIGQALIAGAVLAILSIAIYERYAWVGEFSMERAAYLKRTAFVIFTHADIPLVPQTIAGLVIWAGGYWKRRHRLARSLHSIPG